jgi:hypothetical protein
MEEGKMRTWIASASLALAIAVGATLPATAKSNDNSVIVRPYPAAPWQYQTTCKYGAPGNQDDRFCVTAPAQTWKQQQRWNYGWQPGWQNGWGQQGWNPGWGQPSWQQGSHQWGQRFPEQALRQQLHWSGYSVGRIRFDDDDNVYRVRAKDSRGRDVKLTYDAYSGRLLGKTTNTHD